MCIRDSFKAETPLVPSPEAIAEAVSHVNYENIIIRDNTVKLTDPHAGIDLGAIAKGYIADRIKDYLEEEGVRHAMINLGGNVLAMGSKLDGSDYNIGIQEPLDVYKRQGLGPSHSMRYVPYSSNSLAL